jgi:hypothetical protein
MRREQSVARPSSPHPRPPEARLAFLISLAAPIAALS